MISGFSSLQKASGKFVQNEFSYGRGASLSKGKGMPPLKHFVGFFCVKVESLNCGRTTVEVVKNSGVFLLKQRRHLCRIKHSEH